MTFRSYIKEISFNLFWKLNFTTRCGMYFVRSYFCVWVVMQMGKTIYLELCILQNHSFPLLTHLYDRFLMCMRKKNLLHIWRKYFLKLRFLLWIFSNFHVYINNLIFMWKKFFRFLITNWISLGKILLTPRQHSPWPFLRTRHK